MVEETIGILVHIKAESQTVAENNLQTSVSYFPCCKLFYKNSSFIGIFQMTSTGCYKSSIGLRKKNPLADR